MEPSPHRGLDARVFVGAALLTLAGIEGATRVGYRTRDGLQDKAERFAEQAREEDKNLVILGTCLPEQHLLEGLLQDRLGSGWVVHNLGNQATSPLDWYLAFSHELPLDRVDGVLIAHGRRDLVTQISAWESRVTEVATWGDMPGLISHVCHDADCGGDLVLRKLSTTWRYRIRIANRFWSEVGAQAAETPVMPPPPTDEDLQAPLYFLGELLQTAKDAEIPVWMVPLPYRETGDPLQLLKDNQRYHSFVDPVIEAGGATVLASPELPDAAFVDDSHVTKDGAITLTKEVAAFLRTSLALPEPPETPDEEHAGPAGPRLVDGVPVGAAVTETPGPAPANPSGVVGPPAPGSPTTLPPAGPAQPPLGSPDGAVGPPNGVPGPPAPGTGPNPGEKRVPDPPSASPTYIAPSPVPQGPPLPNTPP